MTRWCWLVLVACAGQVPETRYYQLAEPKPAPEQPSGVALVIEPLTTDAAYDDDRIVYRVTPYRFDYYNYHRWSSAPGSMIGNYLERAFEGSGKFTAVTRTANPAAPVTLGGRVVAIEEVDHSRTKWIGRIVLELTLTDTHSGRVLWSEQYEETQPLSVLSPEGLARALSVAVARIAARAIPVVAEHASEQSRVARAKP